jgi:hypothetical protein
VGLEPQLRRPQACTLISTGNSTRMRAHRHLLPTPPPRSQADRERQLATLRAEEEDALCGALSKKAAAEEAAAREVQLLMEESAELRE